MSATLASLRIRHLALVEDLFWEPPPGFVAVTGETGAGKSIILGALKLLLGERAEKSAIRAGSDSCTVEGEFFLPADSPVHAKLADGGVEPCEEGALLLRRVVATNGPARQFVNGSPCTLALLKDIGDGLVDLHGPHDHQSLFSREAQLKVLDAFAGCVSLHADYSARRREWLQLTAEKKRLTADEEAIAREIDLLGHQVAEINEAALQTDEESRLLERQRTASNARRLGEICSELAQLLVEDEASLGSRCGDANRLARELARLDPSGAPILERAQGLFESVQDLSRAVDRHASGIDADSGRLAALEARLDTIQALKRKYGTSIGAILEFGANAAARLRELEGREARAGDLDRLIGDAGAAMREAGARLGKARREAAPRLEIIVKSHLGDLGFARAGFSILLEPLAEPAPAGMEMVEFLFAPNPGEPEHPLRSIASSGEISRVMLALKTALAGGDTVSILVFDEIDANVGGEVGARVGAKMKELADTHQVFCITHLPQVAAAADAHFVVSKDTSGSRTTTRLLDCRDEDRVTEIARMLGGQEDSARTHARTLLARPKPVKPSRGSKKPH